jgi:hypothetical protein
MAESVITTFFPSHFRISNIRTAELQGAHLPFLVDLVSFICNIEYTEPDSNWWINNLSNRGMMRRDLNATGRILWDLISGHWIHLHLVYIYRNNQNMIVIVAVRPNVILGRHYLFSRQIEPSVLILWQNMRYCSNNYPFSTAFKLCFREIFAKGENRSSNFL